MKKYVCAVCGWTTEADVQPAECPICKAKNSPNMKLVVNWYMQQNTK